MKTLIVGLGNPIFRDDNIGICVVRELASQVNSSNVNVVETFGFGLDFLDLFAGYEKVIIIDAIQSNRGEPGQVFKLSVENLRTFQNPNTSHNLDFPIVIEIGKRLGLPIPAEIVIFGIEIGDVNVPDDKLSPEIEKAIPVCLNQVLLELNLQQEECYGNQSHSCRR